MRKAFYYKFFPTKAEEEAVEAGNWQINRVLVEIRDVYPPQPLDPNNPWQIRKVLASSDIMTGKLMLSHKDTFDHIFRHWTLDMANYVVMGNKLPVVLWDVSDDKKPIRYHNENIFFGKVSHESYFLGWTDLILNRHVNPGDEIGLYWEFRSGTFQFKVLRGGI